MRLPVVPQISTKDGVSAKNARLTNCLKESKKSVDKAVVRPGLVLQAEGTGVGGGLVAFNNELVSVYGATLGKGVTEASFGAWEENSMGSNESWLSIAWNGIIFCALGGGRAATSSDGVLWSLSPGLGPGYGAWCPPAWNGTLFCSVKDLSNSAATSTDGLTWSASTLPATHNWRSIAWNGTLFCAVAYDGRDYATSPDGVVWTARQLPAGMVGWCAVYNGSILCVTGVNQATTSTDGISWTAITSIPAGGTDLAWNGSVFCSLRGGTDAADISTDGIVWTSGTLPDLQSGTDRAISNLGTTFCVIGGNPGDVAYLSTDNGASWVETDAFPNTDGGTFSAVAGGASSFVIVIEGSEYADVSINTNASIPALATIATGLYDFTQSPL